MKEFFIKKDQDKITPGLTLLNYFSEYSEEKYSNEMFPRIVEYLLLNPSFNASQLFPLEIATKLQHLFSLFLKDTAEFMINLSAQHHHATSRVKLLEYYEADDFKNFYQVVNPSNYRAFDFFPIHSAKDSKALKLAIQMNFPVHDVNKFGIDTVKFALDNKKFENAIIILEKLWEEKKLTFKIDSPGMNVNQQDQNGQSLLMHAIKSNCEDNFIEWLLKTCYADPTLTDHDNFSVLDYVRLGMTSRRIAEAINENVQLYTNPGSAGPHLIF